MSNTEDYLDSLLNNINSVNMTGKNQPSREEDISTAKSEEIIRRYKQEQEYKREKEQKREEERRREQEFLNTFEEELSEEEADDFLHQFELELEAEDGNSGEPIEKQEKQAGFFENIEGIVESISGSREPAKRPEASKEKLVQGAFEEERLTQNESQFLSDVLGPEVELEEVVSNNIQQDVLGEHEEETASPHREEEEPVEKAPEEVVSALEEIPVEELTEEELVEELSPEDLEEKLDSQEEQPKEPEYATEEAMEEGETGDEDLLDLLSDMQDDEDISEIGDLLKADQENIELEESGLETPTAEGISQPSGGSSEEEIEETAGKKKKGAGKEKKGLIGKLADMLFGDDEEETKASEDVVVPEMGDLENISEENLEILKELESAEKAAAPEEPEGKKKKRKREKKEKKEKKPKEKKERKKREKKPKPPKEKDNTPPLPKKPVILIFLMAASILVLVLLMSKLIGYTSSISAAKDAMDNADYIEAYKELSGLELKKADKKLYTKAEAMASVQEQHDAYLTLMSAGEYEMALDALVRGVGRYDAKLATAKKYGLEKQLNVIEAEIEDALDTQFDMTADDARELYSIRKRKDYSIRIQEIIEELNLGQVEE